MMREEHSALGRLTRSAVIAALMIAVLDKACSTEHQPCAAHLYNGPCQFRNGRNANGLAHVIPAVRSAQSGAGGHNLRPSTSVRSDWSSSLALRRQHDGGLNSCNADAQIFKLPTRGAPEHSEECGWVIHLLRRSHRGLWTPRVRARPRVIMRV